MKEIQHFDIIIAGGGLAGLSLAWQISRHNVLGSRKVLIIDREEKKLNDRTWCFWEKENGPFEEIIYRSWDRIRFMGTNVPDILDIQPYRYKMIRGIDFYSHVMEGLSKFHSISFLYDEILGINDLDNAGEVITSSGTWTAEWVFNSSFRPSFQESKYNNLLQHFLGYFIETKEKVFDPDIPTFMDFRVDQKGDVRFAYVLPSGETTGLVEFTLFSPALLSKEEYPALLDQYIRQYYTSGEYRIAEEEFGIIPMSDQPASRHGGRHIINIGTAGGATKASTGYTFVFVQDHIRCLVEALAKGRDPHCRKPWLKRRFHLYDSTLLHILRYNKYPGHLIFSSMFSNNPAPRVLAFLKEESTLRDEARMFTKLPIGIFLKAFLKSVFR